MSDLSPDDEPRPVQELAGISAAVRALIIAIDEVDDAERDLDHRVRAEFGVNSTDLAALQYIDRVTRRGHQALARDIGRRFDLSSGSATEVVNRLERADLIQRTPDPRDARNRTLHLTARASHQLEQVLSDVRTSLNDLLLGISGEEEARLIELLNSVRDIYRGLNLQDPDTDRSASR